MKIEQEARVAAAWWADVLRRPVTVHDNGEGVGSMLATMAAATAPRPDEEQVGRFQELLARRVQERFESDRQFARRIDQDRWTTTFGVDYGPDGPLATAVEEAGIDSLLLPCKTVMWLQPGRVFVSEGYGAERVYLMGSRDDV